MQNKFVIFADFQRLYMQYKLQICIPLQHHLKENNDV